MVANGLPSLLSEVGWPAVSRSAKLEHHTNTDEVKLEGGFFS